jgi:hypothetical protein
MATTEDTRDHVRHRLDEHSLIGAGECPRCTATSQAVTGGESVKAVQAQLGHRSEQSTHKYAHLGSGPQRLPGSNAVNLAGLGMRGDSVAPEMAPAWQATVRRDSARFGLGETA